MVDRLGKNNPMFGKKHLLETREKMSAANKGENHPNYGKPKHLGSGSPAQAIEVTYVQTKKKTSYVSIHEAARALNIKQSVITMYFSRNQKKPYKGLYIFKKKQFLGNNISVNNLRKVNNLSETNELRSSWLKKVILKIS